MQIDKKLLYIVSTVISFFLNGSVGNGQRMNPNYLEMINANNWERITDALRESVDYIIAASKRTNEESQFQKAVDNKGNDQTITDAKIQLILPKSFEDYEAERYDQKLLSQNPINYITQIKKAQKENDKRSKRRYIQEPLILDQEYDLSNVRTLDVKTDITNVPSAKTYPKDHNFDEYTGNFAIYPTHQENGHKITSHHGEQQNTGNSTLPAKNEEQNTVNDLEFRYENCLDLLVDKSCKDEEYKSNVEDCCYTDANNYANGYNGVVDTSDIEFLFHECVHDSVASLEKKVVENKNGEENCLNRAINVLV